MVIFHPKNIGLYPRRIIGTVLVVSYSSTGNIFLLRIFSLRVWRFGRMETPIPVLKWCGNTYGTLERDCGTVRFSIYIRINISWSYPYVRSVLGPQITIQSIRGRGLLRWWITRTAQYVPGTGTLTLPERLPSRYRTVLESTRFPAQWGNINVVLRNIKYYKNSTYIRTYLLVSFSTDIIVRYKYGTSTVPYWGKISKISLSKNTAFVILVLRSIILEMDTSNQ